MSKTVAMSELSPVITEVLQAGGEVTFTPSGTSMMPMLHDRTDKVILKKAEFPLKKYDLPLYCRDDGKFILHRVVEARGDGTYIMCGDNQWIRELGIRDDNIIGVVKAFERNGKVYNCTDKSYILYCRFWDFIYPARKFLKRGGGFIARKLSGVKKLFGR